MGNDPAVTASAASTPAVPAPSSTRGGRRRRRVLSNLLRCNSNSTPSKGNASLHKTTAGGNGTTGGPTRLPGVEEWRQRIENTPARRPDGKEWSWSKRNEERNLMPRHPEFGAQQ